MTQALRAVLAPLVVHRLGRAPDPWAWPDWSYATDEATFGNRYDDPLGAYRVLYASTQRRGCFLETLARFRPDPALVAELAGIAEDPRDKRHVTAPAGAVPVSWLKGRRIGRAVYEQSDAADERRFAGLRYLSRVGDEFENWALFEPASVARRRSERLSPEDPELIAALDQLGLVLSPTASR